MMRRKKLKALLDEAISLSNEYRAEYRKLQLLYEQCEEERMETQRKLEYEICKYQRQVTQHEESVRLLDSYMDNNARQAQDIIELESVAIALYDTLWHMVYSVEDELKPKNEHVLELNAYKTIVALFEAEDEE